jgi:4-hydroxybenzoate polyprenyltransferase
MLNYLRILRPHHWIKNLFIFIPAFFAGSLFNLKEMSAIAIGLIPLCLCASAIYIFNDIKDKPYDTLHPKKSKRPIAAGKINIPIAISIMLICLGSGLLIAYLVKPKFFLMVLFYIILNIAYTVKLKQVAILDIIIIAIGFVIRIKCGGILGQIGISQWLMIMVFLLALFLAIGKRRDDLVLKTATGNIYRKSTTGYQIDFLNTLLAMVSAIIIMAYLLYCISPETMQRFGTYRLYYTALFVMAGLLRYLQVVFVFNNSGSPVKLIYTDRFIQVSILLWLLSFYLIIYFPDFKLFLPESK